MNPANLSQFYFVRNIPMASLEDPAKDNQCKLSHCWEAERNGQASIVF